MSASDTRILLDVSRLISRVRYSTPSGIDRVEMAYARGLLGHYGARLQFVAVHPTGVYGRPKRAAVLHYLDALEKRWSSGDAKPQRRAILQVLPEMAALIPRPSSTPVSARGAKPIYVQASPHHLTNAKKVQRIMAREQARFLCFVHDIIPMEFPEYARESGAALHRRRMDAVSKVVADSGGAILVNSAATGRALRPYIDAETEVHVALLGTEALPVAAPEYADGRPYFLCLGTIEPRKNHLLLLNLWRQFAEKLPPEAVPRLVIVGRRGWENEQIIDMLDRCPALHGLVEEISGCSDQRLSALLRGTRALLMPSFAEGFGMPVAEALSVGTPVICSDIDAHKEVGGTTPHYLDPLDGNGWKQAIMDFAEQGGAYQAQLARIPSWHNPSWDDHMQIVIAAINSLANEP